MRAYLFWTLFILFLPFIWRKPFWGLLLYTAVNIVRLEMLVWGGYMLSKIYPVLFGLTILAMIVNSKNFRVKTLLKPQLALIFWLYIAILISITYSQFEIPRVTYYATEILKMIPLCFLIFTLLDDEEKIKKYQYVMLICWSLMGVWGIQQHFLGNERLEGFTFGESNGAAALFVLFLPVAIANIFSLKEKKLQIPAVFQAALMILFIIFTQSRGGFLGLATTLIILIFKSKYRLRILLTLPVLFFAVQPFLEEDYLNRLKTMESEDSMDASGNSRLVLWEAGFLVFMDNPILGTGFMTYPEEKMAYEGHFTDLDPDFRRACFRTKNKKVTHNTYIQLLSDLGLFGFLPFFFLIAGTFIGNRNIRRQYRYDSEYRGLLDLLTAIEVGIIGYCVCIIFMDSITNIFFPVQIAVCACIRERIKLSAINKMLWIHSQEQLPKTMNANALRE